MGLLIDSKKSLISILIQYVEEKKKHGNSSFHFIRSQSEFEDWKKRGYSTTEEIAASPEANINADATPGMPIKATKVDPNKKIESLKTWWQRMTWKDQNSIYTKCLIQKPTDDGKVTTFLDNMKFRDLKLKTCLKKWDLRTETGDEILVNDAVIDSLVPEVAQELISNYERVVEGDSPE